MKKNFRLTIEIKADIPAKITPQFVKTIIDEVDKEGILLNYQPPIDKLQSFIDYIINNENFHEQCISGDLLFKFTEENFEEKLNELLGSKCFDHFALDISQKLDKELKDYIYKLYEDTLSKDDDSKVDAEGNLLPIRNTKKDTIEALKREIDSTIIQSSLLNYTIIAASLKTVNKIPNKGDRNETATRSLDES
ncbi:MAG: hypothetical protein MUF15_05985, partial [Acidobacteria bacterium]|jgi:hypothetical protein|nr:hypothetical protein [Acidobacteriota bacterium]